MKRGHLQLLALACGVYVAVVLVSLPATLLTGFLASDTVRLAGIRGSVWQGTIDSVSVDEVSLSAVEWRIQPLALLTGALSGTVAARLPSGFISSEFRLRASQTTLNEIVIRSSLDLFANYLPISGVQGTISGTLDEVVIEAGWPTRINGSLRIANLLAEPLIGPADELIALGSYRATFSGDGSQAVTAELEDTEGPLDLEGQVTLGADRSYALEASLNPRASAQTMLLQGLELMAGPADADNRRSISFTGSL